MAETPDSQKGQPIVRRIVRSGEDAPAYYINNTEVGMTTWDISLRFARIEKADAEALYLKDQATITMSLQHAKAVVMILASYIRQYEADNGPLATAIPGAGLVEASGKAEIEIPTSMFVDEKERKER